MCNACGFFCCGYDGFSGCGCDGCWCKECWSDDEFDDDEDDYDQWEGAPASRFKCTEVAPPADTEETKR